MKTPAGTLYAFKQDGKIVDVFGSFRYLSDSGDGIAKFVGLIPESKKATHIEDFGGSYITIPAESYAIFLNSTLSIVWHDISDEEKMYGILDEEGARIITIGMAPLIE